jgi:hypothetical protein
MIGLFQFNLFYYAKGRLILNFNSTSVSFIKNKYSSMLIIKRILLRNKICIIIITTQLQPK